VLDAEGAPYLRYFNHKMKREALVPIDDQLRQAITDQQAVATGGLGASASMLLPRPTKNPDGAAPISSSTYRAALYRWLAQCDVRDEHGRAVHFTPHQWRHTVGTRLKVRGIASDASFDGFGDRDLVRDLAFRGFAAAG
jgi:integrase